MEEIKRLRNYAQAREIRLQIGAKEFCSHFTCWEKKKKMCSHFLKMSDFSSVDLTQVKKSEMLAL